jgi:hypothetical protein
MSQEKFTKEAEALSENITEMLASTAAVKGEAFADAVAINFECVQLMDIVGRLTAIADEGAKEAALALHDACLTIVCSIGEKAFGDISDKDLEEVMSMGRALNKRRNDFAAVVLKRMSDAD